MTVTDEEYLAVVEKLPPGTPYPWTKEEYAEEVGKLVWRVMALEDEKEDLEGMEASLRVDLERLQAELDDLQDHPKVRYIESAPEIRQVVRYMPAPAPKPPKTQKAKKKQRVQRVRRAISLRLRFEVLKKANFRCVYCGTAATEVGLQIDHVHPVALGGTNTEDNLVAACRECNAGKGAIVGVEAPR